MNILKRVNVIAGQCVSTITPGDVDGDNDVDIFDLVIVAKNFGLACPGECTNIRANQDGDTDVDIFDLVIVAKNFG